MKPVTTCAVEGCEKPASFTVGARFGKTTTRPAPQCACHGKRAISLARDMGGVALTERR